MISTAPIEPINFGKAFLDRCSLAFMRQLFLPTLDGKQSYSQKIALKRKSAKHIKFQA
jgi:hypothetical protein